jgi:hypothetical protein
MNLQPSNSVYFNERRELFAWELMFGGHGQVALTGSGTFTPTNSSFVFYKIDFLTNSTVSNVSFRNKNIKGDTIYTASSASYAGLSFPANYSWDAPITSITLSSGSKGIAYEYLINDNLNIDYFDFR